MKGKSSVVGSLVIVILLGFTSACKDSGMSEPTPTLINENDDAEMVYVSAGEFLMGSEDGGIDETPEHTVYLDGFHIYKYEVTNTQFAGFLNAQGNQEENGVAWLDAEDSDVRIEQAGGKWVVDSDYEDHPVVEVSWYGAKDFCEWVGGRLPTEAEWEKAARGEDGQTYPWGEESPTCNLVNYLGCLVGTEPVGSYMGGASPYGALDMGGNVAEWVWDWYVRDYYGSSPGKNPSGPEEGTYRMLRGGSWSANENYLRASARSGDEPYESEYSRGFRCLSSETP